MMCVIKLKHLHI